MAKASQDDERSRLEHVLEEIRCREVHERKRQETADTKLIGTLAILPIIMGLSTTAYFEMLPYAARFGAFGSCAALTFVVAIFCFVVAVVLAVVGLWPTRGTYSVVGLATIKRYLNTGTYHEQLRHMINERADAVRSDGNVNAGKLGMYMAAQKWILAGVAALAALAAGWLIALIVCPTNFISNPAEQVLMGQPPASVTVVDTPARALRSTPIASPRK